MGPNWPSWMKWYKKPSWVDIKEFSSTAANREAGSRRSSDSSTSASIPPKLSLERILKNETCSPMSLYDFYMYLKYIELSPENLEFYLWFRDYQARYAKHPGDSSARRDGTSFEEARELAATDIQHADQTLKEMHSTVGKTESQSDLVDKENHDESLLYIESLVSLNSVCNFGRGKRRSQPLSNPFGVSAPTPENYHQELSNIADLFLAQGSPKELNIPDAMRKQALKSISTSTSPQGLEPVASHIYLLLRSCSHRNFVRLGVSNGTFETLCMATGLGIMLTVSAFLGMFLLAFVSHASRWRGLGFAPMWAIGGALILAGMRGSCFFLLLFSRRQPLPWERFDDGASVNSCSSKVMAFFRKLMILDRRLRVKDIHLRRLQTKIVIQSMVGGVIFAALMETFFLLLPIWR